MQKFGFQCVQLWKNFFNKKLKLIQTVKLWFLSIWYIKVKTLWLRFCIINGIHIYKYTHTHTCNMYTYMKVHAKMYLCYKRNMYIYVFIYNVLYWNALKYTITVNFGSFIYILTRTYKNKKKNNSGITVEIMLKEKVRSISSLVHFNKCIFIWNISLSDVLFIYCTFCLITVVQ